MGFRERILARREAYRETFRVLTFEGASLRTRALARLFAFLVGDAEAFRVTISGVYAERVLADLRRYCNATRPTFDPHNERISAFREGRRDVWLRIAAFLQVTEDQVYSLAEADPKPQTEA